MGSALYISIKDKPKELDSFMNGKALASAWEALDRISEELKLPNLNKLCNNAWKAPEKGIPIFESYLAYVTKHSDSVPDANEVLSKWYLTFNCRNCSLPTAMRLICGPTCNDGWEIQPREARCGMGLGVYQNTR